MKARTSAVALMCFLFAVNVHAAPDAAPTKPDAAAAVDAAAATPATKKVVQDAPKDVPEAIETGTSVWSAFKGGKYREAISGCILMLMFFWRRFAAKLIIGKLNTWQVGFVTVLLGFIGSIPEALAVEPWNWKTFLWCGVATSGTAMLFWKTVGQKVLPKVFGDGAPKSVEPKPENEEAPKPEDG